MADDQTLSTISWLTTLSARALIADTSALRSTTGDSSNYKEME